MRSALLLTLLLLLAAPLHAQEEEPVTAGARDWLSGSEQAWLADHAVLRHGVIRGHEPFEFVDDEGNASGLTSDYVTIIGERLGIRFETVIYDSFAELGAALERGDVDISSYLYGPHNWTAVFPFSDPIIRMPIAVFGRSDADLVLNVPSLETYRVAVERPSRAFEIFSRDWPDLPLVFVDTPLEGMRAVMDGEVDYFIHNVFSIEYLQRKHNLEPLRIALMTPYTFDIQFATREAMSPLVPMMHKVMSNLSDYERSLIFDKWVNLRGNDSYDWSRIVALASSVVVVLLLVLAGILYWNRRLTHEVESRTRDVQKSRESLRALALHMDRIREEEKSRLSLEIHDELGHTLTAMAMTARRFANRGRREKRDAAEDDEQIDELRRLIREATATSRRIMSDLRPSVLEDLGLVAAIEWLAHEFEAHYGIACKVDADDMTLPLRDGAPIALFRIAQESLTNIAKHAEAGVARITMEVDDNHLVLSITDDGKGMPASWEQREGSFGLLGMQERAIALGGQLRVEKRQAGGTRIRVTVPLSDSLEDAEMPAVD